MDRLAERQVPRALLWEAVAAQPETFDRMSLDGWFRRHASWVDRLVIDGLVTGGTVNDPGRRHVPGPEDVLFLRADGRFEHYEPLRHGSWSKLGRPQTELREPRAAFGPLPVEFCSPHQRFREGVHEALGDVLGGDLEAGEVWLRGGIRQGFDLVSSDGRMIGHTVWLNDPDLGWARLAEAVWLLQQVPRAALRFVVVGGDRQAAERWVAERGPLANGVEVYFFGNEGVADLKAEARSRWHDRPAV